MTMFEIALGALGYPIASAKRDLAKTSALSGTDLRRWQEERCWEVARFHAAHNPAYRRLLGGELPKSWSDLPVVSKSVFQQPLESLLRPGISRRTLHLASTSGSSGQPFFFARDRATHARSWALIGQRYGQFGLGLDSRQARFYGIPLEGMARYRERMKDRLMNRARFPVFDLSDPILGEFVRRFDGDRFEYVYGYTNSLVIFARYLRAAGVVLSHRCPTLRACITTSEMFGPADRSLLENAFGVPVVNEYGASETGIIAIENPDREWVVSQETLFLETVDDEGRPAGEGVAGEILVTDLFNRAMPFIRYRIGDRGALGQGRQGRQILGELEGRVNDTIRLPSGRTSPGLTFYYVSRSLLEQSGLLREFVIRQTALDEFVFDVVSESPLEARDVQTIESKMALYLEPGLKLRINRVAEIPRLASGKRKHFFSEIERPDARG